MSESELEGETDRIRKKKGNGVYFSRGLEAVVVERREYEATAGVDNAQRSIATHAPPTRPRTRRQQAQDTENYMSCTYVCMYMYLLTSS